MTLVGHHPNIELMSYSEVEEVAGFIGSFKVRVRRKASYVDSSQCSGCAECDIACPVEVPSEYELGLAQRKAIYRPFPQAVPNVYTIDKRGYPPCRVACPAGVNAQGYVALIAQGKFPEALEVLRRTMPFAGVCGRVCTHPCELDCTRGEVDQPVAIRSLKRFMADYELGAGREKAPAPAVTRESRVAIIGSGPAGLACAYDLVRQGYPVTVFEAAPHPGGMLRYGIPHYRLPQAILDNEIDYIKELGVEIRTDSPVKDLETIFNEGYQAVFLGTGAWVSRKMRIPGEDNDGVIHALDLLRQVNLGIKVELGKKVAVIGGGNAAVDATRVARRSGVDQVSIIYRRSRTEMPAVKSEVEEAEREGINLHFLAAPVSVLTDGDRITGIRCLRMELGEADASGRRRPIPVEESEFDVAVDSVIVAVGQAVDKSGMPPELEFTAWGTLEVEPVSLETNIEGVFAGGDVVSGPADVIGAVAAGKRAAESIDRYLSGVDLREGRDKPIEMVTDVDTENVAPAPRQEPRLLKVKERRDYIEVEQGYDEKTAIEEAQRCLNCGVCCECLLCVSACERAVINHDQQDEVVEVEVGNIIVATGYDLFQPRGVYRYGYGELDNVITGLEFERIVNASGPTGGEIVLKDGRHPQSIAIIHCVGSRDKEYHEYCSRVCCMYSLKFGHLIREHVAGAKVYEYYVDIRAFGKGFEEFYNRVVAEGTEFIAGRPSGVVAEGDKLVVEHEADGKVTRQPVDMVILSTALEPREDTEAVGRLLHISRGADGFFLEKHPKLDPVATTTGGVFVVGCCQGPKDIPDTVAQAAAAAAEVLALISRGTVEIDAATAVVDERICSGCRVCELLCPFTAISFDADKAVCRVNEALCKGCGACIGGCLSDAISLNHFTNEQIVAEMEGMLVSP